MKHKCTLSRNSVCVQRAPQITLQGSSESQNEITFTSSHVTNGCMAAIYFESVTLLTLQLFPSSFVGKFTYFRASILEHMALIYEVPTNPNSFKGTGSPLDPARYWVETSIHVLCERTITTGNIYNDLYIYIYILSKPFI